jgi:two-component system, NarL family, sensor kinase
MQVDKHNLIVFLVITTTVILFLVAFVITLIYLYQRKQLTYHKQLETLKLDHEKNLLSAQVEMQEVTFQHISREIHDNINLALSLAKLNLHTIQSNDEPDIKNQIECSLEQISKAICDLSDISKSLNSDLILNQGLLKALQIEFDRITRMNVFQLKYRVTGDPVFMDSNKELIVFRIIQEAINNIIKHADATAVDLELYFNDGQLYVSIADNGIGFSQDDVSKSLDADSKAGLNNMKKRAAVFNGNTIIESAIGKGTRILVTIPC